MKENYSDSCSKHHHRHPTICHIICSQLQQQRQQQQHRQQRGRVVPLAAVIGLAAAFWMMIFVVVHNHIAPPPTITLQESDNSNLAVSRKYYVQSHNAESHVLTSSASLVPTLKRTSLGQRKKSSPRPLDENDNRLAVQTSAKILHVHVGKAGGLSFWKFYQALRNRCKRLLKDHYRTSITNPAEFFAAIYQNSTAARDTNPVWTFFSSQNPTNEETAITHYQTCMLGRLQHAHMKRARDSLESRDGFSHYVVLVRNPIHRLVSWFYYDRSMLSEDMWLKNGGPASQNAVRLFRTCYPNMTAMVQDSLLHDSDYNDNNNDNPNNNNTTNERTGMLVPNLTLGIPHTPNAKGKHLDCRQLARSCLWGEIMCHGHNYYNFEYYVEELLLWKGLSQTVERDATTTTTTVLRPGIRIDVLRVEHTPRDLNRTVSLWTGHSIRPKVQEYYQHLHGNTTNQPTQLDALFSQPIALRQALCRHLCTELVVYKKILSVADNLPPGDVEDSYRDLDETCGFSVDAVCGTEFYYRHSKGKKWGHKLPW